MKLFNIALSDGTSIDIFANDYDHAAVVYAHWCNASGNDVSVNFEIKERNLAWPCLSAVHAREALSQGIAGIGLYDATSGWRVVSPGSIGKLGLEL